MLLEIRSDVLRVGQIPFHKGLNVVLGDENGTNSIGKSTLLMIVDFALGGNALLRHNTDLVDELGHHSYFFTFQFAGEVYRFCRGTQHSEHVHVCDENFESQSMIEINQYTAFLKQSYEVDVEDISFRTMVTLFVRVWGKDNLSVHRPLHVVQNQPGKECIDNLIKTFGLYHQIKGLAETLADVDSRRKALNTAVRNQILPKIGKREYATNAEQIGQLRQELEDIKQNLARYATNLSAVVNREVLQLKVDKDTLLATRLKLASRLTRTQQNLDGNRHIRSKHFEALIQFFPEIDKQRLARVEEFHSGIAKLLRDELKATEKSLREEIGRIDSAIADIDSQMSAALSSVDQPTVLVDRVYDLATTLKVASEQNQQFENELSLKEEVDQFKRQLSDEKTRVLTEVEAAINYGITEIVTAVFGSDRKSPRLALRESSYTYEVHEDTGTGTAYASLLVFDLTVFEQTQLPVIVHDSLLFKNIENDSVARLLHVYTQTDKQSFVALDEIEKYGPNTAMFLRENSVVQLDDDNVLYIKDWRR